MKPTARLTNWAYRNFAFSGNVYGNPRFVPGYFVVTSPVIGIAKDAEDVFIIETQNTNYILDPAPQGESREQLKRMISAGQN